MENLKIIGWGLGLILSLGSANAFALSIRCADSYEGNRVLSGFDSAGPHFWSTLQNARNGQNQTEQYLSPTSACGAPVQFAAGCTGEAYNTHGQIGYSFTCRNGIAGEVYFSGTTVSMSCSGPGVSPDLEHVELAGCQLSP